MLIVIPPDDDMKYGTDYLLGDLRIAYRQRYIPLSKYRQISIRSKVMDGYVKCEIDKILSGVFKAGLYIFEFKDAWVICRISDIADFLKNHQPDDIIPNFDNNLTSGSYINIDHLPHLIITKEVS